MDNQKQQLIDIENERIYGDDLFVKVNATKFYLNILQTVREEIKNNDWWDFPARVLSLIEIEELYDKLFPKSTRKKMEDVSFRRRPPELEDGDSISAVLEYLYRQPLLKKKFLTKLKTMLSNRINDFEKKMVEQKQPMSSLQKKFEEIDALFKLSKTEADAVLFIYLCESSYWELGDFGRNTRYSNSNTSANIAKALRISESESATLFSIDGNLRKFGMLSSGEIAFDHNFKAYLDGATSTPLSERYYTKFEGEALPWEMHGKLAMEDGRELIKLMEAKQPDVGQNILLYGLAGTGKSSFAQSLATKLGKQLYFINQSDRENSRVDYSPSFRFGALEVANLRLDPENTIVCVDECDKLIANAGMGASVFKMLGLELDRDGESKGMLNSVLDNLKLTTIWIANSRRESIDPSSRRRFDYNVYFDTMSGATRRFIWNNALKRYHVAEKLSDDFLNALSERYEVNAGGIDVAVKNAAAVLARNPSADLQNELLVYLKAHCNILNIVEKIEYDQVARDYSLDGLNIKSGPALPRIIDACKNYIEQAAVPGNGIDTPRMNVLLTGAPGTGKTEFVKYLAQQLGKKLTVKMASDLLDCYVGCTEQRIVNAFREAEVENTILFIDEGDSMLGTRMKATRSWETTQVTTLLNQMEHFKGILVMATNFAQNLDPAAIRRFTFKLQFDYLNEEGKQAFYHRTFAHMKLPAMSRIEQKALNEIKNLTPGDFRNVRQQFFYLAAAELSNGEILKALGDETMAKDQKQFDCMSETAKPMGFGQ